MRAIFKNKRLAFNCKLNLFNTTFYFLLSWMMISPAGASIIKKTHTHISDEISAQLEKLSNEKMQNKISSPLFTIVIDAGHGGKDAGAIGRRGIMEKTIVLAIAKKLAQKINQHTSMHAILTRKGDYFVSLRQRLKLARKGQANLFIAIHADAYFDNSAVGASVYALSQRGATSEAARWLAQRDNYAELGAIDLDLLKDRSPMLRSVLIDLAQTATIQESVRLGNRVLDALDDISSLHYSRVEQAPFVVLKSPDIPSILVEVGFITNPKEELRLANAHYQQALAAALWQGIDQYIKKYAAVHTSIKSLSTWYFHSIVRNDLLSIDDAHVSKNSKTHAPFS